MKIKCLFFSVLVVFSCLWFGGCGNEKSDSTTYQIECVLTDNLLTAKESVNYYNDTETAINELKFNLFGNAFRKDAKYPAIDKAYQHACYYNGQSFGEMEIKGVYDKNTPLEFLICGEDQNILSVKLGKEIYPEESVEVVIEWQLTLAQVIARTGITPTTINLANFYPILCARNEGGYYECNYYSLGDPFFSDVADYTVKITLDENYVLASTGKLTNASSNGTTKTLEYNASCVRNFAIVLSKQFQSISTKWQGVEITYYYLHDKYPDQSLATSVQALEYFSNTFGKYPYETYSVVQTPFNEGGMEFATLVYISDSLDEKAHKEVIVHETAHQWWQSVVGNNEIEYGFLDEGLAEYSVVLFYENHSEYGFERKELVKQGENSYHSFATVFDKLFGKVNTAMVRPLKDFKGEYEYVNIAYIKGFLMHEYLRQQIGDELYFKSLKRYYETYAYKNATPDDLVGAFEKSGANSNGFFQSFFDGSAII